MLNEKVWGGRFAAKTEQEVDEFNASIHFDYQLAEEDILGSLAHVTMLTHCNIISQGEATQIKSGLQKIYHKLINNQLHLSIKNEDIHMNIERLLLDEIGPIAGKLHTARSRNDQVALDTHLYLRKNLLQIIEHIIQLQKELLIQAKENTHVIMPGYTHLQAAQPILFSHHLLAYVSMLQRDITRLQQNWSHVNQLPLGACALAGTSHNIDREYVLDLLGFDGVYTNSIDAVSDRDFIIEFLAAAAIIMQHLSRLCEELVLWSSQQFAFIELHESFCTGSSIMPQKKNPDVPELIRGKTGRVYGALMNVLTMMKSLPLAYNKDMQEDKEPLFDTVNTLKKCLSILTKFITAITVNQNNMLKAVKQGYMNATDLADYLVKQGFAFREAHKTVGEIVQYCVQKHINLEDLTLDQFKDLGCEVDSEIYTILDYKNIVNSRNSLGGTSTTQVIHQIQNLEQALFKIQDWLNHKREKICTVELATFKEFIGTYQGK